MFIIDLSKTFDKVKHHALFIKLMNRNIPLQLLDIIYLNSIAGSKPMKYNDKKL